MALLKAAYTKAHPNRKPSNTTWVDTTSTDDEWVDATGSTILQIVIIASAFSNCKSTEEINSGTYKVE
eukprot:5136946-Ditylum_brightwellii.AAC.1